MVEAHDEVARSGSGKRRVMGSGFVNTGAASTIGVSSPVVEGRVKVSDDMVRQVLGGGVRGRPE